MEINEKKSPHTTGNPNAPARSDILGVLAVVLTAFGAAMLGWSLWMLPPRPAYGFPWAFAGAVIAFLPIAAGGWMLNSMAIRRYNSSYRVHRESEGGAIPFAICVIIAGAMLLAFNASLLPHEWKRVIFSWQMLLLVIAMSDYARRRYTWASVMLAVGGFFIIRRLAPIYPDIASSGAGGEWWPVLLIVAGVLILGSIFFKPGHTCLYDGCGNGPKLPELNIDPNLDPAGLGAKDRRRGWGNRASGVIDIEVLFGGSEQVYLDPVFRGGKISTVFGGVKLDLRRTSLPEGETWLKVENLFGGVDIDTPEDWVIEIRGESVFGGFYDKRLPPVEGNYIEGRKLIIKATSVFGGGEIR